MKIMYCIRHLIIRDSSNEDANNISHHTKININITKQFIYVIKRNKADFNRYLYKIFQMF